MARAAASTAVSHTMRSVLVVVTRQIGDLLLTTPLIAEARSLWPDAAIDVLGFEGTLGMLEGHPGVRELIAVPARPGLGGTLSLARSLWRRYDLALVAQESDRAHLLGWIAARQRTGLLPASHGSNWWKRRLLAHAVMSSGDLGEVHTVTDKLGLLDPWRTERGKRPVPGVAAPPSEALPDSLAARLRPGYVVVHTPSMWTYKQWPLAHFRELLRLLAEASRQVVLTRGPAEQDRAAVAAMEGAAPPGQLVDAGVISFGQVAGLLRGASLYIGPDTSVSHLAAACGIPVLAIFGPTNPQRWAPWPGPSAVPGERFQRRALAQTVGNVTLVQGDLPCVPCGKAGCENHNASRSDCLVAIAPRRVAAEALRILEQDAREKTP